MRTLQLILCSTLAAAPALAAPTTRPAEPSQTVNVPVPREEARSEERILVLPFYQASGGNYSWIGKAIQQDLVADLSRATRAHIDAPGNAVPAADASAALAAARSAGATLVIYGQYQAIGDQMRITGQILSAATGDPGGSLSATGAVNDLFPLEDQVAGQALRALPPGVLTVTLPPAADAESSGDSAPIPQNAGAAAPTAVPPGTTSSPQYYSYTYPDYVSGPEPTYAYDYSDYPYYWYAYPFYGPDIYFYGGWDHYHHYGGWHHGQWNGHFHEDSLHEFGGGRPSGGLGFSHAPSGHFGGNGGGFHGGGGGSHDGGGGGGHRDGR